MANHKSAEKRDRQYTKKHERNIAVRSEMRTVIKKVREAVTSGNKEQAVTLFNAAQKIIDKTSQYGIVHKKTGARYVSNLSALIKKM